MNENFHTKLKALHQADCDLQKENLEQLERDKDTERFLEQQAFIGRLSKAGMEQVLAEKDEPAEPDGGVVDFHSTC